MTDNAQNLNLEDARVVVLGFGRSGRAVARHALAGGAKVVVSDRRSPSSLKAEQPFSRIDEIDFVDEERSAAAIDAADLVVVSPGVPAHAAPLLHARSMGRPVISEIDLVASAVGDRTIAITGSNGKSTTTALTAAIFCAAGFEGIPCGNYGRPLVDAVENDHADRRYALEMSSFQLETTSRLRAAAVIILNIQADHLDRHGSLDAYANLKLSLAALRRPGAAAVVFEDDEVIAAAMDGLAAPLLPISLGTRQAKGGWLDGDQLVVDVGENDDASVHGTRRIVRLGSRSEMPLAGSHNVVNILSAAAAASSVGISASAVRKALDGFHALPHRLEPIAEIDGIRFINDSKATNVSSTMAAVEALATPDARLILLLGGRDKDSDFRALAGRIDTIGATAVTFGEAGSKIGDVLAAELSEKRIIRCETLQEAIESARNAAEPGDTVLLSPACASFDAFESFAERGEVFTSCVRSLASETRHG